MERSASMVKALQALQAAIEAHPDGVPSFLAASPVEVAIRGLDEEGPIRDEAARWLQATLGIPMWAAKRPDRRTEPRSPAGPRGLRKLPAETELGRQLRELRERKGWRQDELASAVRTPQGQISKIEHGQLPTPDVLDDVARALEADDATYVRLFETAALQKTRSPVKLGYVLVLAVMASERTDADRVWAWRRVLEEHRRRLRD